VAIESDDEAHRAAERITADIASGDDTADVFAALYSDPDGLWIGHHLGPLLHEALQRWNGGDRSLPTQRLVAVVGAYRTHQETADADAAVAAAERAAERRTATSVAIEPPPDLSHRMTGVGIHGIPLPDDITTDGEFGVTHVAAAEPLMAFYIHHLRATGWTLDLDHSNPGHRNGALELPPQCYFSRPDLPGRYVAILTAPGAGGTRLLITEHEN
jgi:hypothetical protein